MLCSVKRNKLIGTPRNTPACDSCCCTNRAVQAALAATASPLLEVGIAQATGIVWNITGPPDMSLFEVCRVCLMLDVCVGVYAIGAGALM